MYSNRTCHSKGCSDGGCFNNSYEEENLVQSCNIGCEEGKCISPVGDINEDCKVGIIDLAAVGMAYGSVPGDDNWNVNADLNNDGIVNIFDLALVGMNYGDEC